MALIIVALMGLAIQSGGPDPASGGGDTTLTSRAIEPGTLSLTIDPRKRELIDRYFRAIRIGELTDNMVQAMAREMAPADISTEDARNLPAAMLAATRSVMPLLLNDMALAYDRTFTVEELEGLVAYYESPVGRSVMDKSVTLSSETARILPDLRALFALRLNQELAVRSSHNGVPTVVETTR